MALLHFSFVRRVIQKQVCANRCVDMASMDGYIYLLHASDRKAELITIDGHEKKVHRLKSANYIFEQNMKARHIEEIVTIDPDVVDLCYIDDNGK